MQPNTSMKTHPLKHTHDRRREEVRGGYSQPSTSNNSMETHILKHIYTLQGEKRCGGYSQLIIHRTIQLKLTNYLAL